jgi:hypothetical protein
MLPVEQRNCRNCNHCVVHMESHASLDRCLLYGSYCDVILNPHMSKFVVGGLSCKPDNLISWAPKPLTFWQRIWKWLNTD